MRALRLFLVLLLSIAANAASAQYQSCRAVFTATPPPINACADGTRYNVAVVGDVLLHQPLQRQGYASGFHTLWGEAVPFLRMADLAIANLEGPIAPGMTRGGGQRADPGAVFDGTVYTSYPMFNYNPVVLQALKEAGVDLVTTANNHALDRFSAGADMTIAQLEAAGLPFVGTVRAGAPRDFSHAVNTRIGRLIFIACTFSTNGIGDPNSQVLHCYREREALLGLVRAHASRADTAGVIVMPHWGIEYTERPASTDRQLAAELVAAGASAVIGTHPHVVQSWEILQGPAGNVPVIYSTGNFVSGQVNLPRQTGMLAWLELCRARPGGDLGRALTVNAAVGNAGWVAMRMARTQYGRQLIVADPEGIADAALPSHQLIERLVPGRAMMPRMACTGAPAAQSAMEVSLQ
ncbi:CapA family protein [Pelagovum pacificum]|uniref:CapA family protein n=1 Tax=Pelagovum pacificum TaxID=2588711 RepID=A0A5C5GEE8_9RHOB|nr:CapA family protein [Pelagovum pacificum]QQA44478.1 CapA family protein [Pelagovum pacificum]TNY32407.1 CapA family protein [Pelagovum pacificum]